MIILPEFYCNNYKDFNENFKSYKQLILSDENMFEELKNINKELNFKKYIKEIVFNEIGSFFDHVSEYCIEYKSTFRDLAPVKAPNGAPVKAPNGAPVKAPNGAPEEQKELMDFEEA